MKSQRTEEFLACFERLPREVRAKARKNYRLWKRNPAHPALRFKRVHPREPLYSVRIGLGWRAMGMIEGDTITWFWIGSHANYDTLIRHLRRL